MLPILEQRAVTGPSSVLALIGEVVAAAVAANRDDAHPTDLAIGQDGRVVLVLSPRIPEASEVDAPELAQTGPTPATLVFSAGALGVLAALGNLAPAPPERNAHQEWMEDVLARLLEQWGEGADAQDAFEWLGRCLAFDQFARPSPNEVIDAFVGEMPALAGAPGTSLSMATPLGLSSAEDTPNALRADPRFPIALAIVATATVMAFTCSCGVAAVWVLGQ